MHLYILYVLTAIAVGFCGPLQAETNWRLVWSDEFDYTGLPDSSRWSYDVGGHGWGNGEEQFYTRERTQNARVEDGVLTIEARREYKEGRPYTSARLVTKGKGDWTYGRFEVRARLPSGRGTWPAIWMLASHNTYGQNYWPDNGEIDIMEHVGYDPDVVHATIHTLAFNHTMGTQRGAQLRVPKAREAFHTYSVEWTPEEIRGYVDTTQRENLILSGNLIKEVSFANMSHRFLLGAEYVDTSSNQDRWNTYWSETADDKETFSVTRPMGIIGGVGTNALGARTVNDFTVDQNDDTRVGIEVASFYLQDEMAVTDYLDIVLGARFDQFEIDVFNVPADDSRSKRDEEVSPRMGLVLKPMQNMSLYASYSESFVPRSGEQFANINGSKGQLDADTFANTELGFKWDISPALSFTAAIFEIEQESPQVADNDPSTLDVIKSETDGFELQLEGQLTEAWYVSAAYSYLDGEQMSRTGSKGLRPRELPENMFSVWNFVQFTPKLGAGLGLTYQDESFINNSNTARLPSYTRVDAALYYQWSDDLRVQLNFENVGDTVYFPSSHSTHQASVGAPFNARLAITMDF